MAGGKQQPKSDEKPEDLSGFAKDGMDKTEFSDPEANTGAAELDQYDATEGETTQLENQETSEETMEEAEDALELIKSEWWEDPTPGDISIDQNELSQIIQKYMDAASYQARTYEEILSGKLSPNETMFYEVNKFDKNSKLVQRIFLPVMPYTAEFATEYGGIMKQYVSYLDTQVKYGKFYRYEIFAWQLVVGTKYFYRRLAKEQYKGLGNIIPGLQSIRSNFELAFQKYKELMQSGFTYYKDGDFPKF